jgi:NitT/TauT family transport system substrate-binding protein
MGRLFIAILAILSFISLYGEGFCQSITFSYSSLIGIQSPLWIARDAGFFKKHKIDANVVYMPGGHSVIQEMLTGRLQMAISAPGAVLQSNLRGTDFIYFGAISNRMDLVVFADKSIKSVQQLRGKKIAVGTAGAGPDYRGRVVFEKLGMRVGTDVVFVQTVGGQPTRLAMLQSGNVDAVVLAPPYTMEAERLGFRPVLEYASVIPHYFSSGYFTRREYIRDNPRIMENTVRALLDATRYVFSNAHGTINFLASQLKLKDDAFLKHYYQKVLLGQIDRDLYPDDNGVEIFLEQERKANAASAKIKKDDFFDSSILDKLRKQGY